MADSPSPITLENARIAVIGLGYVGLPLAIAFAEKYDVLGFDIDVDRIAELRNGIDRTNEANLSELQGVIRQQNNPQRASSAGLSFSTDVGDLRSYNTYIVTVPTPIDEFKAPDLRPLINASEMLGNVLTKGDIVIYESIVYPGCTEEICIPVLEEASGLLLNNDFFVGYSPERVVPGEKIRTLTKIKKVTSGSTPEIADRVDDLYCSIIEAVRTKPPASR